MRLLALAALLIPAAPGCGPVSGGGDAELTLEEAGGRWRVRARGGRGVLEVYVAGETSVPLFGECRAEGADVVFEPRFPLRPGMAYRAVFAGTERTFSIPASPPAPPTFVARVTPTRSTLPENQLKFYLYFSAPMARGEVYRRVKLLGPGGKEVDLPFLELNEELWDRTGTRLTLFFDPGRIKRGLKPREEAGPTLEEGKAYSLVIDAAWPDAAGRPLREPFRKVIAAGAPDETQPDPARWSIAAPRRESKDPLTIDFDEPLDHAMLARALAVEDGGGKPVPGTIEVDREETRWRFHPESPWSPGKHAVAVDTVLEDLAGNSIGRPFEVDVFRPVERTFTGRFVRLPFDVR